MVETSMSPGGKGGEAGKAKAKLATRPKGLNWYHDDSGDQVNSPDFLRTSLTVEDPETWDSTIQVRADQQAAAEALAAAEAGAKKAKSQQAENSIDAFGSNYSEQDLERLVSEAEDHLADDEAFLETLLQNAAGHKGHANELEPGSVDAEKWASALEATKEQVGRDYNSPKKK
jgi:hypothetical protein